MPERAPYELEDAGHLARIRIDADFTQRTAAEALRIAKNSLSNIERGTVQASDELLERMGKLYGRPAAAVKDAYRADRNSFLVRERRR